MDVEDLATALPVDGVALSGWPLVFYAARPR